MMLHTLVLMSLFCQTCVFGVQTNEVKSVSVMEGDSVTLPSDVDRLQKDDQIGWSFGGVRIARIKRAINNNPMYEDDVRFTGRLELDNQTGSLTIINSRTTDSGLYQLTTIIGNEESVRRFSVTVYESLVTLPPSQSPELATSSERTKVSVTTSPMMIALVSATAGSLLTGAVIGMFFMCRKHKDAFHIHNYEIPQKHIGKMMKSEMTEVVYTCFITER